MTTYFEIHLYNEYYGWVELRETDSIDDNRYSTLEEAKLAVEDKTKLVWHYGKNPKFRIVKVEKAEVA